MKPYRKTLCRLTVPLPHTFSGTKLDAAMKSGTSLKRFLGLAPDFVILFPTVPTPGGHLTAIRETKEMTYGQ